MKLIKTTLVGVGQIFLQENGITGLLITLAMFISHWAMGVACFLGSLLGTITAKIGHYPEQQIKQGLYGFNASLSFMCVIFTFGLLDTTAPIIWLLGIITSVISTLIMHELLKRNKPAFTFPFVLTCWFLCWGVAKFHLFGLAQTTPALSDYTDTINTLAAPFYGWAEVNFSANLISGILIFIAIAISSPTAAIWGVAVSTISALIAYLCFNIDSNLLANGIYSFSPILVACVFAGTRFIDFIAVILGVMLAIIIQYAVSLTGLATYTFGFIAASWIMLKVRDELEKHAAKIDMSKLLNP